MGDLHGPDVFGPSVSMLEGGALRSGRLTDLLSRAGAAGHSVRYFAAAALTLGAFFFGSNGTQDANANGETRSLTMVHSHTNETITVTYKQNGVFVSDALQKLNWFLRDWRIEEPTSMAPNLFDIIWYVYREVGATEPIKIMSAYRSPGTNAMLRRRSRAVAKESQHMRGNAMDVHIPGVSMARVREIGMRLQRGGVGYYPSAGSPFVHLDVGSVRSWPRMTRPQLERLFPDGKTVHLPADGVPLANYQAALAEVQARGGSALDYDTVTSNRGKSLWALLFGGDEDDDTREAIGRGGRTRVAARGRGNVPQVAAAPSSGDSVNAWGVAGRVDSVPVVTEARPAPSAAAPVAVAALPATPAPQKTPELKAVPEPKNTIDIASLPVPPIRPRGARFEALVASVEPLPPIRPSSIGLTLPQPEAKVAETKAAEVPAGPAPQALAAVSGMPLPPARPASPTTAVPAPEPAPAPQAVAAIPQPVDLPSPPSRPLESRPLESRPAEPQAVAALPGILTRGDGSNAADVTRAYAAVKAPAPPARPALPQPVVPQPVAASPAPVVAPVTAAPTPVPVAPPRPRVVARRTDPAALVGARPEAQARPVQVTSVTEPPVEREIRRPVTAMSFSQAPAKGGTGSGGFSGSFIRPMGLSFSNGGE